MYSIKQIGIFEAMKLLLPTVYAAGKVARVIQKEIMNGADPQLAKDLGNPFADALTDADLLVEDIIGSAVATLFNDASFYGEEEKMDRVSKYIPQGREYLITLDPINGTRYFKNGLPCYEMIMTFCSEQSIKGVMIYFPHTEQIILVEDGIPVLASQGDPFKTIIKKNPTILLGEPFAYARAELEAQGYTVVMPMLDYHDTGAWDICPAGILDGRIDGMALGSSQLIDNVAIAYAAESLGARVEITNLNFSTKRAARVVVATTPQMFDDILWALL